MGSSVPRLSASLQSRGVTIDDSAVAFPEAAEFFCERPEMRREICLFRADAVEAAANAGGG